MPDDRQTVHRTDLVVEEIHETPLDADRDLDDEYVTFENDGPDALDVSGWTVEDEAGNAYEFPDDVELAPGAQVTLHSGHGTDANGEFYWDRDDPMWEHAGDTIRVYDDDGVLRVRWSFNE